MQSNLLTQSSLPQSHPSKSIHSPAQACWLHFWSSGGLGSWSHRHPSSPSVVFSDGTQRTVLFWKPPPQEAVHWKRGTHRELDKDQPRECQQSTSNPTIVKYGNISNTGHFLCKDTNNLEIWYREVSYATGCWVEFGLVYYWFSLFPTFENDPLLLPHSYPW